MTQAPTETPLDSRGSAAIHGWDAGQLLTVFNGVLTSVAGAYVTTRSIAVTSIACVTAVTMGAALLLVRAGARPPSWRRRTPGGRHGVEKNHGPGPHTSRPQPLSVGAGGRAETTGRSEAGPRA